MTDAGFFKGTSADQDSRFSDKNKKLMKTMKFADNIERKIDMKKIRLELMKPFITEKLNTLMPIEDDVIIEYVFSQLEESQFPDGKSIQIMMTGFLGKTKARTFIGDLWDTLVQAQESPHGIPVELIELKRSQLIKKKEEDLRINASLAKNKDEIERCLNLRDKQPLHTKHEQQHQQVSIQKPRSPPRVIKDTVDRVRQDQTKNKRSISKSRSRSPKYTRYHSRSPAHKRNSSKKHDEKKNDKKENHAKSSSRRFREKTPQPVNTNLESSNLLAYTKNHKSEDNAERNRKSEAKGSPEKPQKERENRSLKKFVSRKSSRSVSPSSISSGSSGSSGSSDISNSSGSSSSSSGSDASSRNSSVSSSSSTDSIKNQQKKTISSKSFPSSPVKGNKMMPILTEPSNCLEDTNEARPLQRILQAEKRNDNDTGRHYSSYSKSSRYEEDNRRYDIKRSSQNNYQSKGEERRNAEQRSRNVEIYDKREHRGHRDEVSRANRYVRNNSNEKFYYEREKSKKITGKSEREREEKMELSKSTSPKRNRNRNVSEKISKKSKKSEDSERDRSSKKKDTNQHRSSIHNKSNESMEIEKVLREKALESLASKRTK